MIYAQRNLAVRLVLDTSECPEAVLPVQGLKAVKAIDFDTKSNFLYWVSYYDTIAERRLFGLNGTGPCLVNQKSGYSERG